jgi:predicted RNA-binding protein
LKTRGLISCTKTKQNHKCKASEMYSASDLFKKAYDYCTKKYDAVAILSAKYGLILPHDEIEPYDLALSGMSSEEREAWAERVFKQMKSRLNLKDIDKVYFHAGENYREHLIPKLEEICITCEAPLKNLSIGKQLAWYKEHNG